MHNKELECSSSRFDDMVKTVMERLTAYLDGIESHPTNLCHEAEAEELKQLVESAPEYGVDFEELLPLIFEEGAVKSLNPTSPGFMGYVPGGGLPHVGIADLISNVLNRYVGVAAVAPVFSQIESNVIRWFSEIVGFPGAARGTLTSGGSLATLSAVITARHACLGEDFLQGVIYVSDQAHHCVMKAAYLAGFPRNNLRVIPSDENFRLSPAAIEEAIEKDKSLGLTPFMLVGSAGTTNTGAIDPLPALHEIAQREQLWFHVDGAYGGFFCMTERGRVKLKGIEKADSIVLDPHKTLFLPYGTGALLVRDGNLLQAAHSSSAAYMPPMQEDDVVYDFCELSPELTRPFRGLRVWLPVKMYGLSVFRAYLDEKLDLAKWIEARINEMAELELISSAELSILAFAVKGEGCTLAERNKQTQLLLQRINEKQRAFLTGTTVRGRYIIRVAVSVFRVHVDRMEMLLEDIRMSLK